MLQMMCKYRGPCLMLINDYVHCYEAAHTRHKPESGNIRQSRINNSFKEQEANHQTTLPKRFRN